MQAIMRMPASASRVALVSLFVLACTTPEPSATAPAHDGTDAAAVPSCDITERAWALDPAGPDGQIHASAAFSGTQVFVAYNRPKAGAKSFDVFLTAFGCDGKASFAPVRVNEDDDNDVDPSIAVAGDTVLVSWAGDASGTAPNLHLRTRAFDRNGLPLGATRTFTGPRNGIPQTGFNIWQGALAPLTSGFAMVGGWGVEEAPAFQAFGARLDAQGAVLGDAFDLAFDADSTQSMLDVASDGSNAWAAWLAQPNTTDGQSVQTARFGATGAVTRGPTIDNASAPTVAVRADAAWAIAQRGAKDVVLQRLDAAAAPVLHAGAGMLPAIALSTTGGAFAAYREAGAGRTIVVTQFEPSGAVGAEIDLRIDAAAPYPLRLVHVADDLYFVAHQQGKSPALRAHGRFCDFRAKAQ